MRTYSITFAPDGSDQFGQKGMSRKKVILNKRLSLKESIYAQNAYCH